MQRDANGLQQSISTGVSDLFKKIPQISSFERKQFITEGQSIPLGAQEITASVRSIPVPIDPKRLDGLYVPPPKGIVNMFCDIEWQLTIRMIFYSEEEIRKTSEMVLRNAGIDPATSGYENVTDLTPRLIPTRSLMTILRCYSPDSRTDFSHGMLRTTPVYQVRYAPEQISQTPIIRRKTDPFAPTVSSMDNALVLAIDEGVGTHFTLSSKDADQAKAILQPIQRQIEAFLALN